MKKLYVLTAFLLVLGSKIDAMATRVSQLTPAARTALATTSKSGIHARRINFQPTRQWISQSKVEEIKKGQQEHLKELEKQIEEGFDKIYSGIDKDLSKWAKEQQELRSPVSPKTNYDYYARRGLIASIYAFLGYIGGKLAGSFMEDSSRNPKNQLNSSQPESVKKSTT